MIIGSGNIAKVLNDRGGVLFFAAGISDSSIKCCTIPDRNKRKREKELLLIHMRLANKTDKCLVYFGSISCFQKKSAYVDHKVSMEHIVRFAHNHCIIRLGNLDWDTNPNTFLNYIRNKQAKGEPVEIRHEYKFMISREQLLFITDNLPLKGKHEISVFGEMKLVKDLI